MQPALQYSSPFLLTMGVYILDPNSTKTIVTANHVRATQNAGSKMAVVMPDVAKKARDWTAAADAIDTGGALVSMYHQLGLFCHPSKVAQTQETAKAIWRARGFELNADVYKHRQAADQGSNMNDVSLSYAQRANMNLLLLLREAAMRDLGGAVCSFAISKQELSALTSRGPDEIPHRCRRSWIAGRTAARSFHRN
uniref:TraC family protein n=1 Tax=Piscinibacter defluvii TaxID=1796922 RepID=UPI00217564CB|nr:DUF5934 domain-containing protein [Piscinibacter defluvii]